MPCPRSNRITWWGFRLEARSKKSIRATTGRSPSIRATGAILRISVMSELPPPYQAMRTAILVEYAPVTIGEQSYICPVRSMAFFKIPVPHAAAAQEGSAISVQTQLNDVAFTQYHLFRSKARIVTDASGNGDAPAGSPPERFRPRLQLLRARPLRGASPSGAQQVHGNSIAGVNEEERRDVQWRRGAVRPAKWLREPPEPDPERRR